MLRMISERRLARTWDENQPIEVCGSSPKAAAACVDPHIAWVRLGLVPSWEPSLLCHIALRAIPDGKLQPSFPRSECR